VFPLDEPSGDAGRVAPRSEVRATEYSACTFHFDFRMASACAWFGCYLERILLVLYRVFQPFPMMSVSAMPRVRCLLPTIALALFACSGESDPSSPEGGEPEAPAVASIELEGAVVMLWEMGRSTQLIARALDAHGSSISGVAFEWTTANPSVATVVDGTVTANGDGWTEVTAAAGGVNKGASIVVATPEGPKDRTDCIACHADAYLGKHGGSGTPETCLQCHFGPTWTGGEFDHPSVANGFELLGVHSLLSCTACHEADGTPKYPGVADDQCISCHQSEYDAQHGGSGTPTTCLGCHTRDAWTGADFDHSTASSGFGLLGAHATLPCTACHEADGTPKYPGVADDQCIACHQADYNGEHSGSGYPTTCLTCHSRDAWTGAEFDHDAQYFPIAAGRHQGKWSGCTTCHMDSSDYSHFSCFACHPHDQARMDDKHSDVSGYAYDSELCYACHPDGTG
jgi:hypothetical protein